MEAGSVRIGKPDTKVDEPLPPPWPLPRFRALSRRQSIVAWVVGAVAGIALAATAVVLLAPTHWLL